MNPKLFAHWGESRPAPYRRMRKGTKRRRNWVRVAVAAVRTEVFIRGRRRLIG